MWHNVLRFSLLRVQAISQRCWARNANLVKTLCCLKNVFNHLIKSQCRTCHCELSCVFIAVVMWWFIHIPDCKWFIVILSRNFIEETLQRGTIVGKFFNALKPEENGHRFFTRCLEMHIHGWWLWIWRNYPWLLNWKIISLKLCRKGLIDSK